MSRQENICKYPSLFREDRNFAPYVAKRRRLRYTTPEVGDVIVDVVNETSGISTRKVSMQLGVPHSTVRRMSREKQLYSYHLQRVMFCHWSLQQLLCLCGIYG
jgi:hypothetical protein